MTTIEPVHQLPHLPSRPRDSHKGTFGKVLIFAGSLGMSGAAVLSGRAALRGGAGLVYVASSKEVIPVIAASEPSYLTIPLSANDSEYISDFAIHTLSEKLKKMSSAVIGPGIGQGEQNELIVQSLYSNCACSCVIDADGLNVLCVKDKKFAEHSGPRILTPHPGEFSRMTGLPIDELEKNGEEVAIQFAQENDVVLLLKGADTIITDGKRLAHNTTGHNGLATGGTGDVLSGLIASLLAQGMEPFEAAQLGAHVHGLSAEMASADSSQRALIASDLPDFIGMAFRSLE